MGKLTDHLLEKRYRRVLHKRELTSAQVEAVADWQLSLPPEQIDCALLSACEDFLHRENSQPQKEAVFARLQTALNEAASGKKPRRRGLAMALLILLLVALAAAGIAIAISRGVFNFAYDILTGYDYSVQPSAQTLVEKDLAALSLNHVDITVREAVYDGREVRVIYAVTDREPTEKFTEKEMAMGLSDKARLDDVTVCDWVELNGESADLADYFVTPGDAPGEMLYYLTTHPYQRGIPMEGNVQVGLPLIRKDNQTTVPGELLFPINTGLAKGTVQHAVPASKEMEGHDFTLDSGIFTATGADVFLTVAGPDMEEREKLAHKWGDALLFTPEGEPLGGLWNVWWRFGENSVTVAYDFTPPAAWPQEMILAIPGEDGRPDFGRSMAVRLE